MKAKGYRGGTITVRNFVARLRQGLPGLVRPRKLTTEGEAGATRVSPRELRWLFAKQAEDLTAEESRDLTQLVESSQEVKHLYQLLQSCLLMLRERRPEHLNGWMKQARESGIKGLGGFVAVIERDYDAIRAGLTVHFFQPPAPDRWWNLDGI